MTPAERAAKAAIEQDFPAWVVTYEFGQPWACRRSEPGVRVRGEDPQDLVDEIVRAEGARELADWAAWPVE